MKYLEFHIQGNSLSIWGKSTILTAPAALIAHTVGDLEFRGFSYLHFVTEDEGIWKSKKGC